jgi:8-oxo-dGTP diphosphatase
MAHGKPSNLGEPLGVVGLVAIAGRRVLLVRTRDNRGFYLPGGKREPLESDVQALAREIREELGCELAPSDTRLFNRYVAQAYGRPNGTLVSMSAYLGTLVGIPAPRAEVSEMHYFTRGEYQLMPERAPAAELVLADLKERGLID